MGRPGSPCLKKINECAKRCSVDKKILHKKELFNLITSNFYSILYYNSEIWHLPTLKASLKQKILSASAKALRVCSKVTDYYQSFASVHSVCKRATPEMLMKYKLALCLYKLYNENLNSIEFTLLNVNQILTGRQTHFKIQKSNKYRVGLNALTNRLYYINDDIPLDWLNNSLSTYKIKCKKLFL